jgi:hypothetical protein
VVHICEHWGEPFTLCIGAVLDMSAATALKPFSILVKLCAHTLCS